MNNLVSLRPDYFIFIAYLKTGGREGGLNEPPEPPLNLLLNFMKNTNLHFIIEVVKCLSRDNVL